MNTEIYGNYRDTKPDTWVAVDRQGRKVRIGGEEKTPEPQKKIVGMFYWTWHGNSICNKNKNGPYDVSKILEHYPDALDDPNNPAWGKMNGEDHHWGEPMFGYYLNDDEYIIRKHAQMLCDAGVDFIAFDASNFNTEKENDEYNGYFRISTKFLLDTYLKIREEGKPTPQATFICPFFTSDWTCVKTAFEDFYIHDQYMPLWYKIDEKPVMLYNKEHITDQKILEFFTFRRNMPDYHIGPTDKDQWPWLEIYPQHPFYASKDNTQPEMVSIGVAQNSVINPEGGWRLGSMNERDETGRFIARGRSFHNRVQPQPGEPLYQAEKGYNFQEQWERAFELNPNCVFITGWNEWIMGRWEEFNHYKSPAGAFVDQFNQEFSRDIEPMRGGHMDDYYYQLVDNIRRFKGARTVTPAGCIQTIDIKQFSSWDSVTNEYLDDEGDASGRLHPGFGKVGSYFVFPGKNDFVASKVAHDQENIYFYVRTSENISPYICGPGAWMQLLIKVNDADLPSWEGFSFTVNRILKTKQKSILEFSAGGWNWKRLCEVDLNVEGNQMALKIPRKALCLNNASINISFKWIDSMNPQDDILELYTHGDTAPNGRFAYLYRSI